LSLKRQLTNGPGGSNSIESGVQHHLIVYNGPSEIENELKGGVESMHVPRLNLIFNIQPSLVKTDFAYTSTFFDVGVVSRFLWVNLEANFDADAIRSALRPDEQTLVEFVLAVAARTLITSGTYHEQLDPDTIRATYTGSDKEELTAFEENALLYELNLFEPSAFPGSTEAIKKHELVKRLNLRNTHERSKALLNGKLPIGRYTEVYEYDPEVDGPGTHLSSSMLTACIQNIRVFETKSDSPARKLMEERQLQA
jgi:hypothetical protein